MSEVFEWNPGEANPKQKLFFASRKLYTGYGGAKGGGKTWAVRTKALLGAYNYPGIRILIMRRTYPELQSNHIEPMLKMAEPELASYNGSLHSLYFVNGSLIHFGHWAGEASELEYNGQEYDWVFLDEATQFTWRAFQFLGGLLRGVNGFPKRMYVTCNPGGVGHRWVKRLFIDRDFITGRENPEENVNPEDYVFIPATVEDNTALLKSSPGYLRMLSAMPENLRRAYRYGDWDSLGGNYFPELSEAAHVTEPFKIPAEWKRYRAFDYGLDMFACGWFAVDETGRSWMYREYSKSGLIVQDAARAMLAAGIPTVICRGRRDDVLLEVARGESVGTRFEAPEGAPHEGGRKLWIGLAEVPRGTIVLDEGAKLDVKPKDDEELQRTLPYLKTQLKALVARDIFDMNEYFQIINETSHIVEKAVELATGEE